MSALLIPLTFPLKVKPRTGITPLILFDRSTWFAGKRPPVSVADNSARICSTYRGKGQANCGDDKSLNGCITQFGRSSLLKVLNSSGGFTVCMWEHCIHKILSRMKFIYAL